MKNNEESSYTSYLDILAQLKANLDSDTCMPEADNKKAVNLVQELFKILYQYSY